MKGKQGFASNPARAVEMGRKGGRAKVPKGFSTMTPERRREVAATGGRGRKGYRKPKPALITWEQTWAADENYSFAIPQKRPSLLQRIIKRLRK